MEPEAQEVIEAPPPKGDELLAELRQGAPQGAPYPERVELKLTLDQASFLYEKLHALVVDPPPLKLAAVLKDTFTAPVSLFIILDDRLEEMPSTTPIAQGKRGGLKFLRQALTLEVRPHEKKYLLRILANKKRDGWRRDKRTHERFASLEVAEIAEEDGGRASFFGPSHPENPHASVPQAVMQKALGELPKRLRMPAEDVAALLAALREAEGNVSKAARQLGQPQRKTARQIERIKKHLRRRGLAA